MGVHIQSGIAAALAALIAIAAPSAGAQQAAAPAVAIDNDDIGGVVTGPSGPEAGVWVIAETRDLPVRYIKIVVTDDQGRYVIPDLPKANYDVWVRGYGLVDSPKVKSEPGKQLNLTAVPAPNEAEAAKYYPAIYWYAMMKIPEAEVFGSKDAPANVKITDYLNGMKNNGCVGCHQLGQLSTRTIPKFHMDAGKTHEEAWVRRIQSGQAGENMITIAAGQLGGMPFKYLGDWTERVAKGELPFAKPTRPQGVERNIVVTLRDWHNDKQYLHDLISTDRRYPTVNGYGPLYGSVRACLQRHADPRPGEERRDELRAADHGRHAAGARARQRRLGQDPRALGLLGRGEHLGQQGQQPQLDDRPEGPRLARRDRPQAGQSRLLQEGLDAIRRPSSFRSTAPTAG